MSLAGARIHWKARAKRLIPAAILNECLLRLPFLYRTPLVRYETNLDEDRGVEDLTSELELALDLEGEILECGSSRCGASAIMGELLNRRSRPKAVYACDSFQGFDRAELESERRRGLTDATDHDFTSTSLDYVKRKLRALRLEDVVHPVQGYFQDTLSGLDRQWGFVLIDCDLESSMSFCAETAWPRLTPGGRMVFDDYTRERFAGARRAVDAFVARHAAEIADHELLHRLYRVRKRA